MKHEAETEYIATAVAARRLGVSRNTVLRAVQRGEIEPALRTPGGALRFRPQDIDAYAARLGGKTTAVGSARAAGAPATPEASELALLYRVLDHLPAAIAYWDVHLCNVFANRAVVEWFGMAAEQMRGRHIREVIGEGLYTRAAPYLDAALRGKPQSFDQPAPNAQDSMRTLQVSYIPDMDHGTVQGLFALVSDITARKKAEEERAQLAAVVSEAGDAILGKTLDGVITSWNRGAERLYGYTAEEAIGKPITFLAPPDRWNEIANLMGSVARGEHISQYETERLHKNGVPIDVEVTIAPIRDNTGSVVGASVVARDITKRKHMERALRADEESLRRLVNAAPISMAILSPEGIFEQVNEAYCTLFGYAREELLGQPVTLLFRPEQQGVITSAFAQRVSGEVDGQHEWNAVAKDGSRRTVLGSGIITSAADGVPRRVSFLVDITERKKTEQHFVKLAHHDPLTGLPNRNLFTIRLRQALDAAHREGEQVALLFIDLDGFKDVNDTLGHDAGDMLLQVTAKRLVHCVREGDTICRLAGDEFTCVLRNIGNIGNAEKAARKLIAALDQPVRLADHDVSVQASVGISLFPKDGADESTLLRHADEAMYRAKRDGKNSIVIYEAGAAGS